MSCIEWVHPFTKKREAMFDSSKTPAATRAHVYAAPESDEDEAGPASQAAFAFGSPTSMDASPPPLHAASMHAFRSVHAPSSAPRPGAAVRPAAQPSAPAKADGESSSSPPSPVDYYRFAVDVLLWRGSWFRSLFYLVSGITLILGVDWLVAHNVPLLTAACYVTLAQMAVNFVRHVLSPAASSGAIWGDSSLTEAAIQTLSGAVRTLAAFHDRHLHARSPNKHLVIALGLWLLALASCRVSPAHLALSLHVSAFVLPRTYLTLRAWLDPLGTGVLNRARALASADRRFTALAMTLLILALGSIDTPNLVIAGFVICVFAHSLLPRAVEEFGSKAGPVLTPAGKSAVRAVGQFGRMVGRMAEHYELTPPKKAPLSRQL